MATGRPTLVRGLALAVAVLTLGFTACADRPLRGDAAPPTSTAERPLSGLTARGHASGLYPGARIRMRVRVHNPFGHAVRVTSLKARVGRGAPGCRGSWVKVRRLRHDVVVPADGGRRVRLRVRMRRKAPDACQGARFPIYFLVTAVDA